MKTAQGAGVAGSVVVVLIWMLSYFGVEMPEEVAAAITGIITWGGAYTAALVAARRRGGE